MSIRLLAVAVIVLFLGLVAPGETWAQGEQQVVVGEVVEVGSGSGTGLPELKVAIPSETGDYEVVSVDVGGMSLLSHSAAYRPGDRVLVAKVPHVSGGYRYTVVDFYRVPWLVLLGLAFAAMVVVVGGYRGVRSILGLTVTFAVLLVVLVPGVLSGANPVAVSVATCGVVVLATLYLVHGFSWKTTAAVSGTLLALGITGVLAALAMEVTRLTGLGTEEAMFLQLSVGTAVDVRGLLLGGIILGALGVIDDVTVGQASTVFELRRANPALSPSDLFWRSMNVGRDHIASTVNTLVLAYAGASLPLLLLFTMGSGRWDTVVSQEMVAVEVVRTLVGSMGIVAAVPLTSLVAVVLAMRSGVAETRK